MPKKREILLFAGALLIAVIGRAVWNLGRTPPAAAGAVRGAPPLDAPKGLFASLFARPSASYAPVDLPAPGGPAADPESGRPDGSGLAGGGDVPLGRGLGSAEVPPPSSPAASAASAGTSALWGGDGPRAAPSAGPAAPSVPALESLPSDRASGTAAAPYAPSSGAPEESRTLRRLKRRAARRDGPVVNAGGPAAPAAPAPEASPAFLAAQPGGVPPAAADATASGGAPGSASADDGSALSAAAPAVLVPPDDAPAADTTTADGETDDSVADITPAIGSPQLSDVQTRPSGFFFAGKKGTAKTVQPELVQAGEVKGVEYTSELWIDANGAGGWYKKVKGGRPTTALKYSKTESLDPGRIPFIVVPRGFNKDFPGVRLGDYAAVSYGGKTLYAVIGDVGPSDVIGAGSLALANGLGIGALPKRRAATGGVTYVILAGSRDRMPPRDGLALQAQGAALFQKSGIPVR